MKIEDYEVGETVQVLVTNPRTNKDEWREGKVTDKGFIYPNYGFSHPPYPKFNVKYTHTYFKVLNNLTLEGEFYDKENEALFFIDNQIKKLEK